MAINATLVLGAVNFTGYLRVSAEKVSDPGVEVFVQYINTPVTNYTLVIPNLDPVDYYVNFREAPDNVSLGTLRAQAFFNALTSEWEYERRFYEVGNLPVGASIDAGGTILTDDYLLNKNVTGVFKEAFRYLDTADEWENDPDAGTIELLMGFNFSTGERFIVEIKNNVGSGTTISASGLFSATIKVEDADYTIDAADKFKRFCLDCTASAQVITLPALSTLVQGDFVYLEHKRDGVQAQSKIVCAGEDTIRYNGLNLPDIYLLEVWLAKGESLYLRKEETYWEIIFDWEGAKVGERMAGTFKDHPNYLPEDGRLLDGDEYPGLWWWINNVLPGTLVITDDAVVTGGYAHPAAKVGLFVKHSTLKQFRLPNTQGISEKGLANFTTYGLATDSSRSYNYPGGYQAGLMKKFWTGTFSTLNILKVTGDNTEIGVDSIGPSSPNIRVGVPVDQSLFGSENSVNNIGVVYLRRI
jgi:hypothetical protein